MMKITPTPALPRPGGGGNGRGISLVNSPEKLHIALSHTIMSIRGARMRNRADDAYSVKKISSCDSLIVFSTKAH